MFVRKLLCSALLLTLWGCSPTDGGSPDLSSSSPGASGSPTVASSEQPSPSPTQVAAAAPFEPPDLPLDKFKSLREISAFEPAMRETETWWANSGIRENRVAYYSSERSVAELEKELSPVFAAGGDNKPYLEGIPAVFSYDNTRICLMRRGDTELAQMFVLAPVGENGSTPQALRQLKLPPVPEGQLKGKKTLVVLATGYGLGEHVDHMLANAGLVITPTP